MEFIWIFPLFIIFPLIGIILIVVGIFKTIKRKSKATLFTGITFLAIPFIYLALTSILHLGRENKLVGKYDIGNKNETLLLKDDGTFELKSAVNFLNSGSGTWEVQEIDSPILILHFYGESEVWLQINENENSIILSSMFGENNITNDLIQHKDNH